MTRRLDRRQFLMAAAGLAAAGAVARSADMKGGDEVVFVLDCSPEACGAIFGDPLEMEEISGVDDAKSRFQCRRTACDPLQGDPGEEDPRHE